MTTGRIVDLYLLDNAKVWPATPWTVAVWREFNGGKRAPDISRHVLFCDARQEMEARLREWTAQVLEAADAPG